jgi:hypothetical protein
VPLPQSTAFLSAFLHGWGDGGYTAIWWVHDKCGSLLSECMPRFEPDAHAVADTGLKGGIFILRFVRCPAVSELLLISSGFFVCERFLAR